MDANGATGSSGYPRTEGHLSGIKKLASVTILVFPHSDTEGGPASDHSELTSFRLLSVSKKVPCRCVSRRQVVQAATEFNICFMSLLF